MSSPRGRRSRASSRDTPPNLSPTKPEPPGRPRHSTSSNPEHVLPSEIPQIITPPLTEPLAAKSPSELSPQTSLELAPSKAYQALLHTGRASFQPSLSRSQSRSSNADYTTPRRWFSARSRSTSPADQRIRTSKAVGLIPAYAEMSEYPQEGSGSRTFTIWGADNAWRSFTHPCGWSYHGHTSAKFISSSRVRYEIPTGTLDIYQELSNDEHSGSIFLIDHSTRSAGELQVFWSSSKHDSHYRYWSYMERFPAHHKGLEETIEENEGLAFSDCYAEALEYLQWCTLESTLSDSGTTVPLPPTVCHQLTNVLKNLQDASSDGPHKIMAVARVLAKKYEFQAKYSFGTKDRDEFLAATPEKKSLSQPIFDIAYALQLILCFGVPLRYRYHILRMETKFLRGDQWRQHVETLLHEWGNLNLLATVFLAAGMAFLSASDVDTATRIAVIVSTLTASASLLTGLFFMSIFYLHVPDPNDFSPETVKQVQDYIKSISNDRGGRVSVFLSMPMVFLLWSVVAFTTASIMFSFSSAPRPSEIYIPIVLGLSVCGMLGASFVGWRIWQRKKVRSGMKKILFYFGDRRGDSSSDADQEAGVGEQMSIAVWLAFASICMSVFLAALNMTAVANALPVIIHELQGREFSWIGTAYLLAAAAFLPISHGVAEIIGSRPFASAVLLIFALGSALSGAAQTMNWFIAARTVQGIGGGGILSLSGLVVSKLIPTQQLTACYGIVGLTMAVASGIGPLVGGALAQHGQWRWIFYLNLPICGVSMLLVLLPTKLSRSPGSLKSKLARIDWIGNLLIVGSSTALVIAITWGGIRYDWLSFRVLTPLILGVVGLVAFLCYEYWVAEHPMVPVRLLSNRTSISGYIQTFCIPIASTAYAFYLPVYFQACHQATPMGSGVDMLSLTLTIGPFVSVAGMCFAAIKSYRPQLWIAWIVSVVAAGVYTIVDADTPVRQAIGLQVLLGAGIGVVESTSQLPAMSSVRAGVIPLRSYAAIWGIVIGSAVLQNQLRVKLPAEFLEQHPGLELTYAMIPEIGSLPDILRDQVREAFGSSLTVLWKVLAVILSVGLFASLFMKNVHYGGDYEGENMASKEKGNDGDKVRGSQNFI